MTRTEPAPAEQLDRLIGHILSLPTAREAFDMTDLLREMGAINADDCMDILRTFWAFDGEPN